MKFYTHFVRRSNVVYVRGYEDGKRFTERYDYQPTLYIPSQKQSKYKTLDGRYVEPINPGSMADSHEFIKKYEDVDNFEVFGSINYPYSLINELYPGKANYDPNTIRVCNIDIEVGSENGFPEPEYASEPITAITFKYNNHYYVLGCGEYNNARDDVTYYWAKNERELCLKFLDLWQEFDFDVITGWNISTFDIPYIVNRFDKILGEEYTKKLSPQRWISSRNIRQHGKELVTYELNGVASLDYLDIYRKFTYSQQESYRLDHIAHVELGENKLDYSEFENLHQLYKLDYQKFIDYNIKDVDLVDRLDQKMKFIEMIYALAYDAKVNINDVFTQVRMWDVLIHNYLMDRNIVVPQKKHSIKDEKYGGAYVKEPQVGSHDWIVSFDLNSLYPHLIMQYNISPETLIKDKFNQVTIDELLDDNFKNYSEHCMAANGHFFRKDVHGFLPEMMEKLYDERKEFKKKMIESQKQLEDINHKLKKTPNDSSLIELQKRTKNDISKYNNTQLARKVQLNSAYGALGNQYFRFYDIRQAEAITFSGQLSIRWIEKKLNEYLNKILNSDGEDYVIASDTDSVYLNLGPLVQKVLGERTDLSSAEGRRRAVDFLDKVASEKIEPFIDKSYKILAKNMNAYDQKMFMKREAIASRGIWTAKKRYILNVFDNEGVRYENAKLKMMGIETVKSSTPSSCRDALKEALKIIMIGSEKDFQNYVENFRSEFSKLPFEEISFPRGVSDIDKYRGSVELYTKGTPIHVRGAIVYNNLIKKHKLDKKYQVIKSGEKVKFCYMKVPNPSQENVLSIMSVLPKEFDMTKYIDYNLQFEKAFLEPLNTIANLIQWNTEPVATLESLFE